MAAVSARSPKAASEAGQILVIAALSMLAIIGGVALVLEGGKVRFYADVEEAIAVHDRNMAA